MPLKVNKYLKTAWLPILLFAFAVRCEAQHRWTPLGGEDFRAAVYDGQNFWLGSQDGRLLKSPDGLRWSRVLPLLAGGVLGMVSLADGRMLACGRSGVIEISDNSGVTWHSPNTGTSSDLNAIAIAGGDTVIACGSQGVIIRSTDRGEDWQSAISNDDSVLFSLAFANGRVGYCSTFDGAILKTADAGLTWEKRSLPATHQVLCVATIGDSIVLAGDNYEYLFRSSDAGLTWDTLPWDTAYPGWALVTEHFLFFNGRVTAMGSAGSVNLTFHSEDRGMTWHLDYDSITLPPVFPDAAAMRGDGTGIRAGLVGLIQRTTDGGISWTTTAHSVMHFAPLVTTSFNTITFSDSATGFAFGDNNRMMNTFDGGATWQTHILFGDSAYAPTTLRDAFFFSKDSGIVVAYGGLPNYFATTNGGNTWTANHLFDRSNLYSLSAAGPGRILLCTDSMLLSSIDRGATWKTDSTFTGGWRPGKIQFLSPDTGYLFVWWGNFPVSILSVLWTTDAGLSWREVFHDTIPWKASPLLVQSPLDGYSRYPGGLLLHTMDGGITWDTIRTACPGLLYDMLMLSDSVGFAVGQDLTIVSTQDGWKTSVLDTIPLMSGDPSSPLPTLFRLAKFGNTIYAVGQENIYKLDLHSGSPASVQQFTTAKELPSVLTVKPNPAVNSITLTGAAAGRTVHLLDILGREVISGRVPASGNLTLDVSSLPSGLYYLNDGATNTKFVKE